jgi:hypothetical protein
MLRWGECGKKRNLFQLSLLEELNKTVKNTVRLVGVHAENLPLHVLEDTGENRNSQQNTLRAQVPRVSPRDICGKSDWHWNSFPPRASLFRC